MLDRFSCLMTLLLLKLFFILNQLFCDCFDAEKCNIHDLLFDLKTACIKREWKLASSLLKVLAPSAHNYSWFKGVSVVVYLFQLFSILPLSMKSVIKLFLSLKRN